MTFNVLGPEMVLNILQCTGHPPTTKNYLAQNVNMAEVDQGTPDLYDHTLYSVL